MKLNLPGLGHLHTYRLTVLINFQTILFVKWWLMGLMRQLLSHIGIGWRCQRIAICKKDTR